MTNAHPKPRVTDDDYDETQFLATYLTGAKGRVRVFPVGVTDPNQALFVEDYVAWSLAAEGRVVVRCEGQPFANIFGSLCLPWLQSGGSLRRTQREAEFDDYLRELPSSHEGLVKLFRHRLSPSAAIRNELYSPAEDTHAAIAEMLLQAMSNRQVIECLRYLQYDYWYRRSGWPDLASLEIVDDRLVNLELIEVKSRRDKVSKSQLAWIQANQKSLRIPFRIVRVDGSAEVPVTECWTPRYSPKRSVWVPPTQTGHPLLAPALEAEQTYTNRIRRQIGETRSRPQESED